MTDVLKATYSDLTAKSVAAARAKSLRNYAVDGTGCWMWLGATKANGYGIVTINRKHRGAHRFFYETHVGPIPEGMLIRHSCDTPGCVNPAHLSLGTKADNKRDAIERGRHAFGSRMGTSKLSEDMVRAIRADGRRQSEIAQSYGVASITIRKIRNGTTWRHLL